MAVAGTVIAAIGTGVSFIEGRKARRQQAAQAAQASAARRRQEDLERRRADIQAARQRRRAAAESRRLRARAVSLANIRGAGGAIGAPGSTIPAVAGNLQSQLNYNNLFINRITTLNEQIRGEQTNLANILGQRIGTSGFGQALTSVGKLTMFADEKGIFE